MSAQPAETPTAPIERYAYTVAETALALGLGRVRTGDLVRAGVLKSVRVGRRVLVPRFAIEEYLRENVS